MRRSSTSTNVHSSDSIRCVFHRLSGQGIAHVFVSAGVLGVVHGGAGRAVSPGRMVGVGWLYSSGGLVTFDGVRERLVRLLGAGDGNRGLVDGHHGNLDRLPGIAPPPTNADLRFFPRSYLPAEPQAGWHTFGMEWKEHVAWLAPILATAVLWRDLCLRRGVSQRHPDAYVVMGLFALAFLPPRRRAVGALLTKVALIL
jgi:hypothetical protein